jgi:signal transduction histidine kinase
VTVDVDGVVRVSDDGPGVPAAIRGRVFDRFSRGDPRGSGAGLGLSIVRQIMERHHGQARLADSAQGACFELDFRPHGWRERHSPAPARPPASRTAM